MCGGRDEPLATKIDLNCLPNKTPIHQIDLTVSDRLHKSYLNANVFSERFVYYSIIEREQNNPQFMPYFIHQILTKTPLERTMMLRCNISVERNCF